MQSLIEGRRYARYAAVLSVVWATSTACSSNGPDSEFTHPSVSVVDSVLVSGTPYGVAISNSGLTYVTLLNSDSIVQDPELPVDGFTSGVQVGFQPAHVVFNPAGTRAYVTNQAGQGMSVINATSGQPVTTLPLPGDGFNLITSADGTKVYVSIATGQVYVVDAGTNLIVDSIILPPAVNGFARHPTDNRIYISSRDGGTVTEISTETDQILRTFTTGGMPQRLVVSRNGAELWVANETLGVEVWDIASGQRDTTLTVGAYGLGQSPDGRKIYVASGPSGLITIIDRGGRSVDTVLTVEGTTRNVAFNARGTTAVVTNESGFVTVIR